MQFMMAARLSKDVPVVLGRSCLGHLTLPLLTMYVVGVAKGWLSLDVIKSRRSLLFFFWVLPEPSPSTSQAARCRFKESAFMLFLRGKVKRKVVHGGLFASNENDAKPAEASPKA
jgi:hypothetical protein